MPRNNYKVSDEGIAMLVAFEGEILKVYKDPVGLPTLGVGHLVTPNEKKDWPVGKKITRQQSRDFLRKDLQRFEDAVNNAVEVPITQNQFDALVSLAFNIGEAGFKRSSVLRNLNNRKFSKAADAFLAWNKGTVKGKTVVIEGLTRRRNTERSVFLTPDSADAKPNTTGNVQADNSSDPAINTRSTSADTIPTAPVPVPVIEVPVVSAAPTEAQADSNNESTLTKIGNKANAAYTAFGTMIAGVIAWFSNMAPLIVLSIMGTVALLGLAYMVINWRRAEAKDARDREDARLAADRELQLKIIREQHAQEAQLYSMRSAAERHLDAVTLAQSPPPATTLPNSDTEG